MNMTPFSGILPIFYKGNANRVEYKIKGSEMDFYFYFRGGSLLYAKVNRISCTRQSVSFRKVSVFLFPLPDLEERSEKAPGTLGDALSDLFLFRLAVCCFFTIFAV